MTPNTCHAGQALLPATHTTPRIPDALLPTTTAAAEGSFATRFTDRETGQSYSVRPRMESRNGECKLPQTVEPGEPARKRQRTEEGAAPAGLLPQPFVPAQASTAGADSWGDPQKTSICASYGAALEPLHMPGLSPQERLQKLEAFRTTCHHLINESWQWLRMDLADEIAAAGEALYSQVAPVAAKQANLPAAPFYDGFEPWGLQMLNACLAQAPLLGQKVQVSLLPTGTDGGLVSPWLPVLRTPQSTESREQPGQYEPHEQHEYAQHEPPVTMSLTRRSSPQHEDIAQLAPLVQRASRRRLRPPEMIARIWQELSDSGELDVASFIALMGRKIWFKDDQSRVSFGLALVNILKTLCERQAAGTLRLRDGAPGEGYADCLNNGFARIGLLNRHYNDNFHVDPQDDPGLVLATETDEDGTRPRFVREGDRVRMLFFWTLAHVPGLFTQLKRYLYTDKAAQKFLIAPQFVIDIVDAHFNGTSALDERELQCFATVRSPAGEKSGRNLAWLIGKAATELAELPPLPVFVPPFTQAGATSTTTTTTTAAGRARAVAPVSTEAKTEAKTEAEAVAAPLQDELEPLFSGFGDNEFR